MTPFDRYDTPSVVAQEIVEVIDRESVTSIADFAAGGGALLAAAQQRWPRAEIFATDIDAAAVRRLQSRNPHWNIGRANFLSERSRSSSPLLRRRERSMDAVILNPPFRFATAAASDLADKKRPGVALQFLSVALRYVAHDGILVAIIPAGASETLRDAVAWSRLCTDYDTTMVRRLHRRTFRGAVVNSIIVSIRRRTGLLIPSAG